MPWPPWHAGYDYDNFEETPSPASAVLPSAYYRRLQKIKAACDPARCSSPPTPPGRPRLRRDAPPEG
ncbi:MAG: hypothetical protein ACRDOL_43125 [Streptosporangiaceae bacterium]